MAFSGDEGLIVEGGLTSFASLSIFMHSSKY